MFTLSDKSLHKLQGVKQPLVDVVKHAIKMSSVDFGVTEGVRTLERQKMLVQAGKSQTMASKHLTGDAVDLVAYVNGEVTWEWKYYVQIAAAMKQAAKDLDINITWGGDWKTLKDGVHFQLDK